MAEGTQLTRLSLHDYWIPTCFTIIGAGTLCLLLYRALFHPLARFPGPKMAALTDLWRNYHLMIGDWHEIIIPLHQRYGKIVRLAPNELSVVDESMMKLLYGRGTSAVKSDWYRGFQPPGAAPNILATQNYKVHSEIRRRLAPPYKMMSILKLEEHMQRCFDSFWQKLRGPAAQGENVDICRWSSALAFDVIGELCYSEPLGMLDDEDYLDVSKIMCISLAVSSILGHVWGQTAWIDNPIVRALNLENPAQQVLDWAAARVTEHVETKDCGNRNDIMDQLIAYRNSEGNQASHHELVQNSFASIGAGADTVSITMRSCLYYLSIFPKVYKKLQSEVDDFHERNNLSSPITYQQTQRLPYLRAVVRETLRMMPSIPIQLPRYVPEEGINVGGQHIAAGTLVGMSPLAQNRDKAIFGKDADVFLPERWLEDESKSRYMESALLTFGGNGPRGCLGKDLAMVELHKFAAQMMRMFDFEFVNKERPFRIMTYFFSFQTDMWMKISLRSNGQQAV